MPVCTTQLQQSSTSCAAISLKPNSSEQFGASRTGEQGDQIGRIFAHWVIVYFWQFLIEK
jgi:hypothetical protein